MSEPQDGLPRATYWWRRVSIALVLVAVVVLAVVLSRLGSSGSSSGHPASPVTSSSTVGTSPSAPPTTPPPTAPVTSTATTPASTAPTTNAAVTCSPSDVTVVVKPATRTFPGAATFTTTLTNTGAACTLPSGLQLVVTSGQDRIWSNVDCTPASAGGKQAVAAGKSIGAALSWDRARSRPACATVIGTKTAGSGVYHVTATWGGATSTAAIFNLG